MKTINNYTTQLLLIILSTSQIQVNAFLTPTRHNHIPKLTSINAASVATTSTAEVSTKIVKVDPRTYDTDDDQIMQVASYRNRRTSPEQMIAAQQQKRDSFDPVRSAIDGVKIGLGIGAVVGIISAVGVDDGASVADQIVTGVKNFVVIGGTTGCVLGYNNYSGNRVYVMDIKEARNRLTVDYVASLKISQDVGFAAYLHPAELVTTFQNGRFDGCNGIVACVDCQLRNSKTAFNEALLEANGVAMRQYPGLPAHVHIKNMDVDEYMRRRGIARQLMDAIEDWARGETDAELLTLEVGDENVAAIKLYEGCGFVKDASKKRVTRGGCSFMMKEL